VRQGREDDLGVARSASARDFVQVRLDQVFDDGQPVPRRVEALEARERAERQRRHGVRHGEVREVRHGVPERRELPVQQRDDARFGRVEDAVVAPKVAVRDAQKPPGGFRTPRVGRCVSRA